MMIRLYGIREASELLGVRIHEIERWTDEGLDQFVRSCSPSPNSQSGNGKRTPFAALMDQLAPTSQP